MAEALVASPVVLGFVGDSGSGKTTVARGVASIIGEDRVAFLSVDDYHRYSRAERFQRGLAPADPDNNYLDIAEQHLGLLRRGQPILKPVYDHGPGELVEPEYVAPKPYIIVEGLMGFATRKLRDCYDVKVFLDPDEPLRVAWKTQRDTRRRGYTADQVEETIRTAAVAAARFVQPQRRHADVVVQFLAVGDGAEDEASERLGVRHILRPTLPHPELTPLLETASGIGVTLELGRDGDGMPVDRLEISALIDDLQARRLERYLWDLVPETGGMHDTLGRFEDAQAGETSHALALTQLLMAYHLQRAAIDRAGDG